MMPSFTAYSKRGGRLRIRERTVCRLSPSAKPYCLYRSMVSAAMPPVRVFSPTNSRNDRYVTAFVRIVSGD